MCNSPVRRLLIDCLLSLLVSHAMVAHASDCNNNGVDDAQDISSGTSQDCNGNAVPDECDVSSDFSFGTPGTIGLSGNPAIRIKAVDLDHTGSLELVMSATNGRVLVVRNSVVLQYTIAGDVPWGLAVNRVNADSFADIVITHLDSNKLTVLMNKGNNVSEDWLGLATPVTYTVGSGPRDVVLVDVDGDADLDAVTANESSTVSVLLNNGNGIFAAATHYPLSAPAGALTAGDFDGDGDIDVAVSGNAVWVLLNNGNGTLANAVAYEGSGDCIAAADLDSDGDLDLVTDGICVLKNRGDATFTAPVRYAASAYLDLADVDRDGDVDIVELSLGLSVRLNYGHGEFGPAIPFSSIGGSALTASDFDGDGDADVAAIEADVRIFNNQSSQGAISQDCNGNVIPDECETVADCNANEVPDFCDIGTLTSTDCNSNGVPDECDIATGTSRDCNLNGLPDLCDIITGVSLDCNNNGTPDECDIAAATSDDCNANIIPDECETLPDCNLNDVFDVCDIASGTSLDCNANSVPDECEHDDCNNNGIPDSCDLRGTQFGFSAYTSYASNVPSTLWTLSTGDFDGDGDADLVVGAEGSGVEAALLLNDGNGAFGNVVVLGPSAYPPQSMAVADLDGDGDLDIAIAGGNPSTVAIYVNDGQAHFGSPSTASVGGATPWIRAGDFDGDGDIDLAIAAATGNGGTPAGIYVLKNNGDGTFAPASYNWANPEYPRMTSCDMDADADIDLVVANEGGELSILRNNGSGGFAAPVRFSLPGQGRWIDAADLDGDGDWDVLVTGRNPSGSYVFVNDGAGNLTLGSTYDFEPSTFALADVDLDGAADFCAAMGASVNVLPNIGNATFGTAVAFPSPGGLLASADVTGNGTYDLITAYQGVGPIVAVLSNATVVPHSLDCNANNTPDECDITNGTSLDCNANGVPDSCDIARGSSTDVNANAVPDECETDVRVVPVPVIVNPSTTSGTRTTEPVPTTGVTRGQMFWIEMWGSDVGTTNTGLTGVYVDLSFCGQSHATALFHGTFATFASGTIVSGGVDEFGGSKLPHGGGVAPQWVRIGWVEMRADVQTGACQIALTPSTTGIAAYQRGAINWAFVGLGSTPLTIFAPSISYDLDGNGTIGLGDLAIFAGSWLQSVPPATPNHDFDCDSQVGAGDLSWFATGWLKSVNDPTIQYPPPCGQPSPAPTPDREVPPDVRIRTLALSSPSASDIVSTLPTSIRAVDTGEIYYIEVWSSDVGDINTGIISAYVDLLYTSAFADVVSVNFGSRLDLFQSGDVQPSMVDELGASTVLGAVGKEPSWVRVVWLEVVARVPTVAATYRPVASSTGVACYGRGLIPWAQVALESVSVRHNGPFCEPCDVNCDGSVNPFDIQWFVELLSPEPPPPCSPCAGDANGDGTVNPFDINAFLACISE